MALSVEFYLAATEIALKETQAELDTTTGPARKKAVSRLVALQAIHEALKELQCRK